MAIALDVQTTIELDMRCFCANQSTLAPDGNSDPFDEHYLKVPNW
ncbi:hypothetical protein L665_03276 [Ralstonia solanacearum SD54]|nr:hypothetical protein L665_03276 [Ralstonia solanacearum SD54]